VPEGMVSNAIPAGKYAIFTTERGPAYKVVPDIWVKINSLPMAAPGGSRTYKADYEVYDERARDPQASVVDVYIGVK
jgi:predicted transcriptional regulator YdeE